MTRIILFIVIATLSYFGLTALIEYKTPEVKTMSVHAPAAESTPKQKALPKQLLGSFVIDKKGSQLWLDSQKQLNEKSNEVFAHLQQTQSKMSFNGSVIWFSGFDTVIPVEIISITEDLVKFKMFTPNAPHKVFFQWDDKGGIWFGTYTHLEDGKPTLYRARYLKE